MIELSQLPLEPDQVTSLVRQYTNGAVVTFLGTTRNNFQGKRVLTLEYEAFKEMAIKKLAEIREEVLAQFDIEDMAISHRIGTVPIGEISLVVAVASPHRKEAFWACHKAVDRLKEIVPIWKKEIFEEGSRWVACEDHEFHSVDRGTTHFA